MGQTYPRRGKAGKIGSTFGRHIAIFKMIEKECFVKVIFIGRNIGIGRIKTTIFLALSVGNFYRAKYWHRKARSDDVSSGGGRGI